MFGVDVFIFLCVLVHGMLLGLWCGCVCGCWSESGYQFEHQFIVGVIHCVVVEVFFVVQSYVVQEGFSQAESESSGDAASADVVHLVCAAAVWFAFVVVGHGVESDEWS